MNFASSHPFSGICKAGACKSPLPSSFFCNLIRQRIIKLLINPTVLPVFLLNSYCFLLAVFKYEKNIPFYRERLCDFVCAINEEWRGDGVSLHALRRKVSTFLRNSSFAWNAFIWGTGGPVYSLFLLEILTGKRNEKGRITAARLTRTHVY